MKTIAYCLGLLLALATSSPAQPFRVGEVLEYDVRYLRVMKGSARLAVNERSAYQEQEVYRLTQDIEVGSFFKNHIVAQCRTTDLMPLRITSRMTRQGQEALGEQVYDPEARKATFSLSEQGRTKSETFYRRHPIQDLVTVLYYIRTQPLAEGAAYPISLWEGEYTLTVAARERLSEDLFWAGDTGQCWVLTSTPSILKAWLTADEYRLPVRVDMKGKKATTLLLRAVTEPGAPPAP